MSTLWSTMCGGKKKKYQAEPEVVEQKVQVTRKDHGLRAFRKLGLSDDDDVKTMLNGSMLWKIKTGWRQQRLYRLEPDGMTIWYKSRRKRARSKQIFSILHIESVREGHQSEGLRKNGRRFPESCCFSVAFMGRRKNLDLAAASDQEARSWVLGLWKLMKRAEAMSQREKLVQIRDYLHQADRDGDEKMSFQEVKDMLRMINIEMNDIYAYSLFKKCDRSNTNTLEDCEIEEFCTQLMHRPELEEIFYRYSGEDRVLSTEELQEFLEHQGEEATRERAKEIIQKYELNEKAKQHDLMMLEGFTMYLLSMEGDIYNQEHRKVYQDMTRPLSHYFISSSHNTYLTNHQLVGSSSTESYIRVFMEGCRCVELDCWEGPTGEPVIYHGRTLTSKILFKDVIATVKDYAFTYSPYPVILSLENHCGLEQQATMAYHLRNILGDMLVSQPLDSPDLEHLPSPEALKGKVLLKGKKLKAHSSSEEEEGRTRMDVAQELSDLVIYCQSVEFRDQPGNVCEMSSFSEDKIRRLIKDSGNALVRYNTRQLSRVYPDGMRTNSSNFSPQEMWNAGCQLVALNFQTPGYKMDLNHGRFQDNGICGYVLKPEFLRQENSVFNPETVCNHMKVLYVRIISAQQLPKLNKEKASSIVDPFVRVEIHSVGRRREQETNYILNNGFNPFWDEELRLEVLVPELALVRFVVEDYDKTSSNDFVGQYTLPFPSLEQGYRHVHLLSKDGASLSPATLFVHVQIKDP